MSVFNYKLPAIDEPIYYSMIFIPSRVSTPGITRCYSVSTGGFYKGLAASNMIGILNDSFLTDENVYGATDYVKKLWNTYKPDYLKGEKEDER